MDRSSLSRGSPNPRDQSEVPLIACNIRVLNPGSRISTCDRSEVPPEVPVVACNICAVNSPVDPVVTTCGHCFCWPCLHRFLQGQAKPCPACATMLSRDVNVVPKLYSNGSLILCLPTTDELERNHDMLDWIRTNTVWAPGASRALSSPGTEDSAMREMTVVFDVMEENNRCRRNLFLTSEIEELQWRARRAKRNLHSSWESWSSGSLRKNQ